MNLTAQEIERYLSDYESVKAYLLERARLWVSYAAPGTEVFDLKYIPAEKKIQFRMRDVEKIWFNVASIPLEHLPFDWKIRAHAETTRAMYDALRLEAEVKIREIEKLEKEKRQWQERLRSQSFDKPYGDSEPERPVQEDDFTFWRLT